MPTYTYTATSLAGEKVSGTKSAKSEHELAGILHKQGYVLTNAEAQGEAKKGKILSLDFLENLRGIPISDKLLFSRNLQVMITAGVPLPRSLDILAKQAKNKKFQKAISYKEDFAEAYNNLGYCYRKLDNLKESLAAYYKALELKPNFGSLLCNGC